MYTVLKINPSGITPRMCGEKGSTMILSGLRPGSPPHVRGKDHIGAWGVLPGGITPACAGKRTSPGCTPHKSKDHPRMCGEKVSSTSPMKCLKGSPPHVRGKVPLLYCLVLDLRITPACAGKRCSFHHLSLSQKDHPRMCGEKPRASLITSVVAGSPPHVRGKGGQQFAMCGKTRITPACAGKSPRELAETL